MPQQIPFWTGNTYGGPNDWGVYVEFSRGNKIDLIQKVIFDIRRVKHTCHCPVRVNGRWRFQTNGNGASRPPIRLRVIIMGLGGGNCGKTFQAWSIKLGEEKSQGDNYC